MRQLEGQVAFVTGAARGLGEAILRTLCRHHATVIGCDVRLGLLERVVAEVNAEGGHAEAVLMDVTSEDQVAGTFDRVVGRHGRLDRCATRRTRDG